jgi:5,5'-dehydrodivanillate O-demethylase
MVSQSDYQDFVHTGPHTLAGRYLRSFWQPIYLTQDLAPGRAVPLRIMSEDFTLYRGRGGDPHLLASRCAHRGTQLSTGWVEDDCIRCFYHGWKYDATGQCVEQPAEDAAFAAKVRIASYPIQEYLGIIFGFLGDGPPPPLPRYPHLEGEGVLTVSTYVRPFNYFHNLENTVDMVHLAFVHHDTEVADSGLADLYTVSAEESPWGIDAYAPSSNGAGRGDLFGMPNIINFARQPEDPETGWTDCMVYKVPLDDESHLTFSLNFALVTGDVAERYRQRLAARPADTPSEVNEIGAAILRGDRHISEFVAHPEIVAIQDFVAQAGQGVIADRGAERLGRSDVGVILLRRIWERELRALAEGRPLKQWSRPAEARVASGLQGEPV